MYADLERIEERGKRKKESKKRFSIFSQKDEEAPVAEPPLSHEEEPAESPEPKPVMGDQLASEQGRTARESEMIELVESQTAEDSEMDADQPPEPAVSEGTVEMDLVSVAKPEEPAQEIEAGIKAEEKSTIKDAETINRPTVKDRQKQTLQDSPFYKRDIYAEIDKIEQRGKSLKEKRSGFFIKSKETKEEIEPRFAPEKDEIKVSDTITGEHDATRVESPMVQEEETDIEDAETINRPTAKLRQKQTLQDSPFYRRDIYADIDRIEQRGKSLKEKRSGIFIKPKDTKEEIEPPKQTTEVVDETPPSETVRPPIGEGPEPPPEWKPLTGKKLKRAQEEMFFYKRKLDKGFKSGKLTKERCLAMVRKKEEELGLKPPTGSS